jgi:hypothetical protein
MRFNVSVPANYQTGLTELRAKVTYQSCNDEVCYPARPRAKSNSASTSSARTKPAKRINGQYFGRR